MYLLLLQTSQRECSGDSGSNYTEVTRDVRGGERKYSSTVYQKILAVSGYQQRLPEESLLLHTRTTQRIQYYSVEGEVLNLNILLLIEIYWISHK